MNFSYVYILENAKTPSHFYVGVTNNLKERLARHNAAENPSTANLRPWRIKTAIAFTDRLKAARFERYLKTASGRAFVKKRL
ncbi:MAG TPA: GIY-YIG nuclease family protein [Verrucomicrobiae bacterium]|jgi:predicted GIY-YIG superfamily endonuclease|nr:GIY-YIG nuclease family protein [Verrucomicrobiae bacterium]